MRTAFLLACLLPLLASAASASTAGGSLCHEEDSAEELAAAADEAAAVDVEEHILPCALIESGQLGAWCPDAAFYVTTPSGTLLCRVLLPAVGLDRRGSSELEERPAASPPDRTPLTTPAPAHLARGSHLARPVFDDVQSPLDRSWLLPRPLAAEPPFVPG